jgi:hypothetical protein
VFVAVGIGTVEGVQARSDHAYVSGGLWDFPATFLGTSEEGRQPGRPRWAPLITHAHRWSGRMTGSTREAPGEGQARGCEARRHALAKTAATAALLGYAWVATSLRPFTWPDRLMTAALGVGVLLLAARSPGRHRMTLRRWWAVWRAELRGGGAGDERRAVAWRLGTAVWGGLILAIAVWELVERFSSPRSAHPTLNSITDPLLAHHLPRFLAYLLWLALGRDLLRR